MIYVTAIRLTGGAQHQHIGSVWWLNSQDGKSDNTTTESMIDFIDKGNTVKVGGKTGPATVGVIRPNVGKPYLRTHADGSWSDNLLALPRF